MAVNFRKTISKVPFFETEFREEQGFEKTSLPFVYDISFIAFYQTSSFNA